MNHWFYLPDRERKIAYWINPNAVCLVYEFNEPGKPSRLMNVKFINGSNVTFSGGGAIELRRQLDFFWQIPDRPTQEDIYSWANDSDHPSAEEIARVNAEIQEDLELTLEEDEDY